MGKQQEWAIENIPPRAWNTNDLIPPNNVTGNQFVDVLRDTFDIASLKAHFKNDNVIKATADNTDSLRKQSTQSLIDNFYVLVPEIAGLHDSIDLSIKSGYHNKLSAKHSSRTLSANLMSAMNGEMSVWHDNTVTRTRRNIMALVGPKNCGKTAAVERCLELYPQVVWHKKCSQVQIVYLKIALKGVSTPLEYCARFLEALQFALGDDKFDEEVRVAPNICAAFMKIRSLLMTYNVGLVVIDSLETIRNWLADKRELLLEHLSGLADIVPVLLISNDTNIYEVNDISLEKLSWDPLCAFSDEEEERIDRWFRFTNRLWKLSCLREQTIELNEELQKVWFDACNGVIGLAVRFFARCQLEAINDGYECISVSLMLRVKNKYFGHHRSFFSDIVRAKALDKASEPTCPSKPKRKKEPRLEFIQRKDFRRVPKSLWHTLPEDDLRYLASQRSDENYYLALKEAGRVLPIGEFTFRDKFPQTLL
jgi:hypothetical protein